MTFGAYLLFMQVEYFGKAGIAWHGAMFVQRLLPDGDGEIDADEYTLSYFDDISEDKTEDGFAVLSCLQADLHTFKESNPDIHEIFLASDGAGCYSGKFLALVLPLLSEWSGILIREHSIGEAGMNKSSLDGHFGVAGPHVKRVVASGQQDATTAVRTAAAALCDGGVSGTVCRVIATDRRRQAKYKSSTLNKVPAGEACEL